MSILLPSPIKRYIQIENFGTPESVPDCFASDAVVRDEGQTYEGLAAIKGWMATTKRKYGHSIEPLEHSEGEGQHVLRVRMAGSFPGSPIMARFTFALADGKIRSLEIRG